jgi:D-aminopeptidase
MTSQEQPRPRARDLGVVLGTLPPGPLDAITDVAGVRVGHATVTDGERVCTGVTLVFAHGGNPIAEKVPAAVVVANGYGKLMGSTQVEELGELESPIALTNTLSVGAVADALVGRLLALPGNDEVRSVNVVVGETNDGRLNDIRGRHVRPEHVFAAWDEARAGAVAEGAVGAGAGTVCFGWKGGIGTASRRAGSHTVGVLVQTNFGGTLTIAGRRWPEAPPKGAAGKGEERGSCMIVVATDAPLDARNLRRLAQRAFAGMARTGASFSDGSGDYALAFSTAASQRVRRDHQTTTGGPVLRNEAMSPLFVAVADATEEAILNSLLAAVTTTSNGRTVEALPAEGVRALLR